MWYDCLKSPQNKGESLMKKKMNKLQNFFAAATFVAALMACADALAEPSTFTAATDKDNNGYTGTVAAGGQQTNSSLHKESLPQLTDNLIITYSSHF
jgi:hypothetical protein